MQNITVADDDDDDGAITVGMDLDDTDEQQDIYPTDEEYLQCCRFFKKYIVNNASLWINIDSVARYQLYEIFGYKDGHSTKDVLVEMQLVQKLRDESKVDVDGLFLIFDDCRGQIYQLLTFAYARFKKTSEYQTLQDLNGNSSALPIGYNNV